MWQQSDWLNTASTASSLLYFLKLAGGHSQALILWKTHVFEIHLRHDGSREVTLDRLILQTFELIWSQPESPHSQLRLTARVFGYFIRNIVPTGFTQLIINAWIQSANQKAAAHGDHQSWSDLSPGCWLWTRGTVQMVESESGVEACVSHSGCSCFHGCLQHMQLNKTEKYFYIEIQEKGHSTTGTLI